MIIFCAVKSICPLVAAANTLQYLPSIGNTSQKWATKDKTENTRQQRATQETLGKNSVQHRTTLVNSGQDCATQYNIGQHRKTLDYTEQD
ncbi:hypothetical protein BgiBS90_031661 [Biomphalaria glabrata]|nr:hypothetical protein BgiBS90_031661 [Biomphalaria glabrata]